MAEIIPTHSHKRPMSPATARDAQLPERRDYIIWDERTPYLGLRVYSGGQKTWFVQKKLNGKPCKVVIGPFPTITYVAAKERVAGLIAQISAGIDPNLEAKKRASENAKIRQDANFTVVHCLDAYIEDRKSGGVPPTPNTLRDYAFARERMIAGKIGGMALVELTGANLAAYLDRKTMAKTASRGGRTQAGRDLRYLRAAYNLCIEKFHLTLPKQNPFVALNRLRKDWYRVKAKSTIVATAEGDLKKWWAAVDALRPDSPYKSRDVIADYLQLSMLWGGRRAETLGLRWEDIHLDGDYVLIPEGVTKNKREHLFPITAYAKEMLLRRKAANEGPDTKCGEKLRAASPYVFPSRRPGANGEYEHIVEPASAVRAVKAATGINGTPHNLRRTFATLFNELSVSGEAVSNALNHAPKSTAGIHYIQSRLSTLRPVYQRYEDLLLEEAGIRLKPEEPSGVVSVDADTFAKYQAWLAEQDGLS